MDFPKELNCTSSRILDGYREQYLTNSKTDCVSIFDSYKTIGLTEYYGNIAKNILRSGYSLTKAAFSYATSHPVETITCLLLTQTVATTAMFKENIARTLLDEGSNDDIIKIGSEFQINTYDIGHSDASVTALSNDNFVAVWTSDSQDTARYNVYGQLFDNEAVKIGGEFQVADVHSNYYYYQPRVASLGENGFVVAWTIDAWDSTGYGVDAQLFNNEASKVGNELTINLGANGQRTPIAVFSDNSFLVLWQVNSQGIYGQLFGINAAAIGSEFQVSTQATDISDSSPAVAVLSDDSFVVAWNRDKPDGSEDLYAQLFNRDSTKIGAEFRVNTYVDSQQADCSLIGFSDNGFVAAWDSRGQDGSRSGIYGQLFNNNAKKIGEEFLINSYTDGDQRQPSLTSFSNNIFVVTWVSEDQNGIEYGIYGQLFSNDATKIGDEFTVIADNHDTSPSVATFSNNNFVVMWRRYQNYEPVSVHGQLFHTDAVPNNSSIPNRSAKNNIPSFAISAGAALMLSAYLGRNASHKKPLARNEQKQALLKVKEPVEIKMNTRIF